MSKEMIVKVTCDECSSTIDWEHEPFIDAEDYGAEFHLDCYKAMSAHKLAIKLNLDDIRYHGPNDADRGRKITAVLIGGKI